MSVKAMSQAWRMVRLFAITFGHTIWVALLPVAKGDKAAVLAAVVAATEAAYRQVLPSGKVAGFVTKLQAAYRVVSTTPIPTSGIPVTSSGVVVSHIPVVTTATAPIATPIPPAT